MGYSTPVARRDRSGKEINKNENFEGRIKMEEKHHSLGQSLQVTVAFCLLVSGCALRPEPISQYNFGEVYVGTAAESPQVRWKNHSDNPLEVVALPVSPIGGAFNMKTSQPFQSFILQSGDSSKYFTFTFTPTQAGAVSGEAVPQIISGKGKAQSLGLSGTGVYQTAGGGLVIGGGNMKTGEFLDFGYIVFPGGSPRQRRFNLVNATNQQMVVDVVWTKGSQGFSVLKPSPPITVPALGRVKVTLQFAPPGVGTFTDGVTFADRANAKNKAGTAVQGKGVPPE